jgi:ATP-dependent helicase/nuclease subunit A
MRAPGGGGSQRPQLVWQDGVAIWGDGKQDRRDPVSTDWRASDTEWETEEEARLLYVALTRAEDRLYVCGWEGKRQGDSTGTWYGLVSAACKRLTEAGEMTARDFAVGDLEGCGYVMGTEPVPGAGPFSSGAAGEALPDWALTPAPEEPKPSRPLAPSRPSPLAPALRSPLRDRRSAERRFRRGTLLHRLLQHLPGIPPAQRDAVAARLLADAGLSPEDMAGYVAAVASVLDDPAFAPVFAADALTEAPLTGLLDGAVVSGTVDRLLVAPTKVLIVDYKTNRNPPRDPSAIPLAYARQMRAYAGLLRGVYPGRQVEAALLWTEVPRLDPVDVTPAFN